MRTRVSAVRNASVRTRAEPLVCGLGFQLLSEEDEIPPRSVRGRGACNQARVFVKQIP